MVHALKNIAIRLWVAAATGGLASLGLLAILGSPMDAAFNLVVAAILTILAFLGWGWIFNRIAALRLQGYLREATSRERTARIGEAAEAFSKAIILFDSFMVSPLFRHRMGRDIAGRVARFHIARAVRLPEADTFVTLYLWAQPNDKEVAGFWLQHTHLGEGADADHLALADRIAAAQPDNLAVQSLIAQIYLAKNRTDYAALQTYKQLLEESSHIQAPTVIRLADLFIREGRADEWALEVYLQAGRQEPDRIEYLKGIAACQEQIIETEWNEPLMAASGEVLSRFDDDTIRQWQASFRRTAAPPAPKEPPLAAKIPKHVSGLARSVYSGISHAAGTAASILARLGRAMGSSWRESTYMRQIAKWTVVIAFAAVVILSGISTIKYIRETKEPPESAAPTAKTPQMATSGRYTIQVGSFRNRAQAIAFSDRIKQRGFPAYWGESRSSDEDIWYYVRISRFEEKQEAKEFGENLKSQGIIDDFYVANYK
jgi:hypothetical protein